MRHMNANYIAMSYKLRLAEQSSLAKDVARRESCLLNSKMKHNFKKSYLDDTEREIA